MSTEMYPRISILLQSDSKQKRKEGLKLLQRNSSSESLPCFTNLNRVLCQLLTDRAEVCRCQTVEILHSFLKILCPEERHLTYLIPILSKRLGGYELAEPSEEVRLKCVSLLRTAIGRYADYLGPYTEDLTRILSRTTADPFPLVKRESCECITEFAKRMRKAFYGQEVNFVKPLIGNLTHQHYKVRLAAVKCIGDIVLSGKSNVVEDVTVGLAERLFDANGIVRAAVIEVSGTWLLDLQDRYSWWHKLLPLLLTGLHDEIEDIRTTAANFWDAAGQKYLQENENDEKLKAKFDFLTEHPRHYPNVIRPNLGCRILAQQTFGKLINGITIELEDWIPDIRVRSAQLLCVMILNIEEDVIQHIEKILTPMRRACNDEDQRVVQNIELASLYLGYFVEPKIYWNLLLPTLEDTPTIGHLRVFSRILRGGERSTLTPLLEKIGEFLSIPHICQSRKRHYQKGILDCCSALMTVCGEECKKISSSLFTSIFTVQSMSSSAEITKESQELLSTLSTLNSLETVEDLFSIHIPTLISSFKDFQSWTIHTPESEIFCACIAQAGGVVTCNMNLVFGILQETMDPNADTELRLKNFLMLSDYFSMNVKHTLDNGGLCEYIQPLLENCIVPGLIWKAGRSAEAVRTAAICCLCALLESCLEEKSGSDQVHNQNLVTESNLDWGNSKDIMHMHREENYECFEISVSNSKTDTFKIDPTASKRKFHRLTSEQFSFTFNRIIPILITLSNDNGRKIRLYSLKAIFLVVSLGKEFVGEDHVHRIYPSMLKRLDDACDDVRFSSLEALIEVWTTIPENYDKKFNRGHIDTLYTTLLIHLDDPEKQFRDVVLDGMKKLAKIDSELLMNKINASCTNFRNQSAISALQCTIYSLPSIS